jgi:crotonobetainyl-CoA:carnitine CoA-transferase CaiB-like acyl-CoA transferase
MDTLQAAGVRAGAVQTGKDMLADPHLNARGYYVPIENFRSGKQTMRLAPYTMSETPPRIDRPAPTLGHDTEAVLRDVLGLDDAELAALAEQGVTSNAPRFRRNR